MSMKNDKKNNLLILIFFFSLLIFGLYWVLEIFDE